MENDHGKFCPLRFAYLDDGEGKVLAHKADFAVWQFLLPSVFVMDFCLFMMYVKNAWDICVSQLCCPNSLLLSWTIFQDGCRVESHVMTCFFK